MEGDLEANTEKTKHMVVVSHHQNADQNHNLLTANKSFENMVKFKYLGTRATHQNGFHEEMKSRLSLGNACYHSVWNLLSSCLLSKKIQIKIHKTTLSPAVLYGYEAWSLILREE
jgi:hypothetical protein